MNPNNPWKGVLIGIIIVVLAGGFLIIFRKKSEMSKTTPTSFSECAEAGNPIMESYPRQCKTGEKTFTEDIGNAISKQDLIRVVSPKPNDKLSKTLSFSGEARGNWFFEASFPVELLDSAGNAVAQGIAQAKDDWMTTSFVPFSGVLTFKNPETTMGTLVFHKDNPSGLPENDDALFVPVRFSIF